MDHCKHIRQLLPAWLESDLESNQAKEVQAHISGCESCREEANQLQQMLELMQRVPEQQPPTGLKTGFENILASEKAVAAEAPKIVGHAEKRRSRFMPLWQVAAAVVILLSGIWIGMQVSPPQMVSEEVSSLRQDVQEMKQLVLLSMLEKSSASERIKAVKSVVEIQDPDEEIVAALINTAERDANLNVRLAAISALDRFSRHEEVRKTLIQALESEDDPIMQIAIINALVSWEEKAAVDPLRNLLENEKTLDIVKNQAQKGLEVLL